MAAIIRFPSVILTINKSTYSYLRQRQLISGKRPLSLSSTNFARAQAAQLMLMEYGDPSKVVKKEVVHIPENPGPGEVFVNMLLAPINPADINTIQGTYAVKPELPAILGNEGLGRIDKVGESVTSNLKVGDWVIPGLNAWGTWRTHAVCKANELIKIRNDIPSVAAATLAVNPCTAYRMLHDFVSLNPGEFVLQNGANSAVGRAVIQLAKHYQWKTINVVRDRPDIDELKSELQNLGADLVLTEEEIRKSVVFRSIPAPRLALNCVGGKSGLELIKRLAPSGVIVTYGAMSRQPLLLPAGSQIFKDIVARGFWMTRWNNEHFNSQERFDMIEELTGLVKSEVLQPPDCKLIPLCNYSDVLALVADSKGFLGRKYIFHLGQQ